MIGDLSLYLSRLHLLLCPRQFPLSLLLLLLLHHHLQRWQGSRRGGETETGEVPDSGGLRVLRGGAGGRGRGHGADVGDQGPGPGPGPGLGLATEETVGAAGGRGKGAEGGDQALEGAPDLQEEDREVTSTTGPGETNNHQIFFQEIIGGAASTHEFQEINYCCPNTPWFYQQ